jgi:ATP-dependent Zn protease
VEDAQRLAVEVLTKNIDKLHKLAKKLLDVEVLDGEFIDEVIDSATER